MLIQNENGSAAQTISPVRRYIAGVLTSFGCFLAMFTVASMQPDLSASKGIAIAIGMGFCVLLHIAVSLRYLRDSDEYISALKGRRFIAAAALAFSIASGWGFAETYADAPHQPAWFIYPLFWLCFAFVTPFIRSTRRGS